MAWRVVPPASHGVSRVPRYSGYSLLSSVFAYRILTFFDASSHTLRLTYRQIMLSATPRILLLSVWPLPLSLATTHRISVDYSSSPYLDVSVHPVSFSYTMYSCMDTCSLQQVGSPIRKSAGHRIFAPNRSLSQLVTSFVGSQCQGIHLVLFLA